MVEMVIIDVQRQLVMMIMILFSSAMYKSKIVKELLPKIDCNSNFWQI